MKIKSFDHPILSLRKIGICTTLIFLAFTSCKKDTSGNDNSFFSFGKGAVETLGTSAIITEELLNSRHLQIYHLDSVQAFYQRRDYEPAWDNIKLREDLIASIKTSEDEGLYFEDYHGNKIEKSFGNLNDLNDTELSRLDILLTDAYFKFSDHLFNGKTDPKTLHEIWDIPREPMDHISVLERLMEDKDLDIVLKQLRPQHQIYQQLIASSKEYKQLKDEFQGFEEIPSGAAVKAGEQDQRLPEIQSRLKFFGYLDKVDASNYTNSEEIQKALQNFQEENGIEADGIIGNSTIKMLNTGYDRRYEQILVNLERWRWYPRELGAHYILVNIANYGLDVVKNKDTVRSHKTMVGTEARKTPIFAEKVEHVVFNPDWTIPPTIRNKDVIPGMQRNSGYLASKNIRVYDKTGKELSPSRIDWNGNEAKNYTYRQNPGTTNPLGRVKIMYPNQYLIYLHDTPSKALFERNSRAQSSGCVRVEGAIDLAKYLLSDQEKYDSKEIDQIISTGTTKQINLKQKVMVYHFYWTAWREKGRTRFTEDIYGYDSPTLKSLRKT